MATEFDTETSGSPYKVVKLYDIGNSVSGAVVFFDTKTTQARDYTTEQLKTWDDGSPQYLTEIYLLVDGEENAFLDSDKTMPAVKGEIVRIICDGSTWFQWKEALAGFREAGNTFSTDTHILWVFDRTEPSSNPKYGAKNVKVFTLTDKGGGAALHAAADKSSGDIADSIVAYRAKRDALPVAAPTTFDEEPF